MYKLSVKNELYFEGVSNDDPLQKNARVLQSPMNTIKLS